MNKTNVKTKPSTTHRHDTPNNKTHIIKFRVTETEKMELQCTAKLLHLSLSTLIRRALHNAKIERTVVVAGGGEETLTAVSTLLAQCSRVGTNLNQLARHFNSGGADTEQIRAKLLDELNVRVFLKIVEQLELKKVTFISIRENLDTSTSIGKFAVSILTELKQLEHENLLERQRIGIEQAKAEGKHKGRKPIEIDETQFERLYNDWQNGKTTPKIMMNELHLKPATFWRKVKDYRNRNKITDAPTMRRWHSDSAEANNKEEL
mgnify:CR=1 FL=1